ncbi:N-acetyltransferase [Crossiella sp. CA198]|uniref:N-acetyltransferase n=1 Tax=Crossiella sp. CA198 TaxID=3455607 RepID=UPI003F8D4B68
MLSELLTRAAHGDPPPPDGGVTVLPQGAERVPAVLAFTAHHVVLADVDPDWVRVELPADDLSAPLNPPFLTALCGRIGRQVNNIDAVLCAPPVRGRPELELRPADTRTHDRVRLAEEFRAEVRVWTCPGGLVLLGRGLGGRWEVAAEVDPAFRGKGLGRALFAAARTLTPAGEPVWAQVAPGNAASLRAVLAAGYLPLGAEALLT